MRNFFYLIAVASLVSACSQTPKFTVNGNIEGLPDGTIYLKQRIGGDITTLDSAKSVGGKFVLQGSVIAPDIYAVVLGEIKQVPIMLENKPILIAGKNNDPRSITITGSSSQDEMKVLENLGTEINTKSREIFGKYKEAKQQGNATNVARFENQLDSLDKIQSGILRDFVSRNPNSFVAPVILQRLQYGMEADEIQGYLQKFSAEVMKSASSKALADRVTLLQSVAVGKIAPDFTMNDSIGTPVKLSEVYARHEYTLIDFWASWCGPCRAENPNLVAVWKDFNAKGFHVIGVSCDRDKSKWLTAIATDKLTWSHVSDLKYWKNAAAVLYGINSIPANLLVDKTGKIIDKNLHGEKLREKMAELLK